MTRDELLAKLAQLGVRDDAYDLDGAESDEAYCLHQDGSVWRVYYAERGERNEERSFASEEYACDHLLERIEADPTTRAK